ncbi:hypothetical protein [Cognatilysobacter bugurensis]|uniref:Uncharacterized protein n=1 Tax=Cognatilysobacter bugurensis TaxID=543356 RepID=A0A918W6F4_9GAMM|nr:hypothetical protein [Lysobacter bugurensis]GHA70909.1 hypothetical protein GCM10007067_03950 [Lysobacter bugurensis]
MRTAAVAPLIALALATSFGAPAKASLFDKKPEDVAAEAARAGMQDVSIWVDVSWGFRNQGAANNLNRSHQVFAAKGYRVLSVEPYIENGDLQGFFVTYRKP